MIDGNSKRCSVLVLYMLNKWHIKYEMLGIPRREELDLVLTK